MKTCQQLFDRLRLIDARIFGITENGRQPLRLRHALRPADEGTEKALNFVEPHRLFFEAGRGEEVFEMRDFCVGQLRRWRGGHGCPGVRNNLLLKFTTSPALNLKNLNP